MEEGSISKEEKGEEDVKTVNIAKKILYFQWKKAMETKKFE